MGWRYPVSGTATCAAAVLLCACMQAHAAPEVAVAQFGKPFVLHEGQSAMLGEHVRVTLTTLVPIGTCPGGHSECVEVSPPQAQVDFAVDGVATHLLLRLFGARSNVERVGTWMVRVVDVQPVSFSRADVVLGRASISLLVAAAGE
jgi:hypothetical protein